MEVEDGDQAGVPTSSLNFALLVDTEKSRKGGRFDAGRDRQPLSKSNPDNSIYQPSKTNTELQRLPAARRGAAVQEGQSQNSIDLQRN